VIGRFGGEARREGTISGSVLVFCRSRSGSGSSDGLEFAGGGDAERGLAMLALYELAADLDGDREDLAAAEIGAH
jgi:hypothetical protein